MYASIRILQIRSDCDLRLECLNDQAIRQTVVVKSGEINDNGLRKIPANFGQIFDDLGFVETEVGPVEAVLEYPILQPLYFMLLFFFYFFDDAIGHLFVQVTE